MPDPKEEKEDDSEDISYESLMSDVDKKIEAANKAMAAEYDAKFAEFKKEQEKKSVPEPKKGFMIVRKREVKAS